MLHRLCIAMLLILVAALPGCGKSEPVSPADANLSPEVMAFIEKGSKVGAVKAYQKETGLSLADAKAELEGIVDAKGLERKGSWASKPNGSDD